LPVRGFVNYPEAQALVRRLEIFAQEGSGAASSVAVLALYQGQVELLRRLVQQSEILRSRALPLEIALPSRLRQRECDLVLLSLTRSHAHRAVAFGEDVLELPLALTRSTGSLIVFGDPGTLSKRATWTGPLDHLDSRAAHEELQRFQRLVAYLQIKEHAAAHANGSMNGKE
jgi:superfamily I DNA and/or RNA helicase